jgi:hypothetical protein
MADRFAGETPNSSQRAANVEFTRANLDRISASRSVMASGEGQFLFRSSGGRCSSVPLPAFDLSAMMIGSTAAARAA